jgi:hypothetical protein
MSGKRENLAEAGFVPQLGAGSKNLCFFPVLPGLYSWIQGLTLCARREQFRTKPERF